MSSIISEDEVKVEGEGNLGKKRYLLLHVNKKQTGKSS